jgi:hypothetical protein
VEVFTKCKIEVLTKGWSRVKMAERRPVDQVGEENEGVNVKQLTEG